MHKIIILLVCGLGMLEASAQQAIVATGSDASGAGGSMSYTVGQIDYLTNTGSNGITQLGVQQPHETYSVKVEYNNKPQISVFPNPTSGLVKVKTSNYQPENLSYQLLDMTGKLLAQGQLPDMESSISMESFVPATYILVVTDQQHFVKTFNINKINP